LVGYGPDASLADQNGFLRHLISACLPCMIESISSVRRRKVIFCKTWEVSEEIVGMREMWWKRRLQGLNWLR
jgi:hypothetical protein